MSLASDYGKLLKYLESQSRIVNSQKKNPNPIIDKSISSSVIESKKAEDKTKKILEECQEISKLSDIPPVKTKSNGSIGFDVYKFESLMRSKLIDEQKRLQSYERPYISVTELCQCIRKSYYNRLKYPVDLNKQYSFPYLYLINHVGNSIHEFIQSLYDFTETEKTIVSDKYGVKGRIDGLRDNFLLELKSIDKDKFKNTYIQNHYHQSLIYSYILNSEYDYNIKTITIVYIIRNCKRIIPFDLPVNDDLAIGFLKRALDLKSCITSKTIPEPTGSDSETCKYCVYKKFCEKDESKIKKPFESNNKDKDQKNKPVFLM